MAGRRERRGHRIAAWSSRQHGAVRIAGAGDGRAVAALVPGCDGGEGGGLPVPVDEQDVAALAGACDGEVEGEGRLADTALGVANGNNHGTMFYQVEVNVLEIWHLQHAAAITIFAPDANIRHGSDGP